jgi:hypothetical protein
MARRVGAVGRRVVPGPRCSRRLLAWAVVAMLAAALGAVRSPMAPAVPIELAAASVPALSAEESALVAQMDPADRARYLLQRQLAERAELAALSSRLIELRHDEAMSVIRNIR